LSDFSQAGNKHTPPGGPAKGLSEKEHGVNPTGFGHRMANDEAGKEDRFRCRPLTFFAANEGAKSLGKSPVPATISVQ